MPMVDSAAMLIPSGVISSTQNFPGLQVEPRFLPTCAWVISMLTPPAASATFTLSVATTQNGTYSPIATLVWPAGTSGSKQVQLGAGGNAAWIVNTTSAWLRASVTLSGVLTLGGSWLSKASGSAGLASRSYTLDGINAL